LILWLTMFTESLVQRVVGEIEKFAVGHCPTANT
jgi:hypothetical protein